MADEPLTPSDQLREMLWKITGRPRRRLFSASAGVGSVDPEPAGASDPLTAHCTTDSPDALHYVFLVRVPLLGPCTIVEHVSDLVPGTNNFDVDFGPTGHVGTHVVRVWAVDECGVPGEESSYSFSVGFALAEIERLARILEVIQNGE